jgi:hypothetical protein
MLERRAQWKFLITDDGCWYWEVERPATELRRSAAQFATLAECALDARGHGYVTCLASPDRRDTQQASTPVRVVLAAESQSEGARTVDE